MDNRANLGAGLPAHPSGQRSLTCNSPFPGLPNCYRCMAKTDEITEQAGDILRQFLKKAKDYQHTNTSTGSSISTLYFQLEEGRTSRLSASNSISHGLPILPMHKPLTHITAPGLL